MSLMESSKDDLLLAGGSDIEGDEQHCDSTISMESITCCCCLIAVNNTGIKPV